MARSDIALTIGSSTIPLNGWITQGKIEGKVYIVDDYGQRNACLYFSLLEDVNQVSDCSNSVLKKSKTIFADKAFWVYVK